MQFNGSVIDFKSKENEFSAKKFDGEAWVEFEIIDSKPSAVKIKAIELGLQLLQPENLKDKNFIDTLKSLNPDIIAVFAFKFLPQEVYETAKIAAFNIHTSLLPRFRGAAPINWAIINGESVTGLTSFLLENKIDAGPIILQKKIAIPNNATAGELADIMMAEAPDFAIKTCEILLSNAYKLISQNNDFESPTYKLFKENVAINWNQSAASVVNFINGCSPVPCAWTMWNDKKLQILKAKMQSEEDKQKNIEEILKLKYAGDFCIINGKLFVNCNDGIVELIEIKLENKNAVLVKDFVNGYRGNPTGRFF